MQAKNKTKHETGPKPEIKQMVKDTLNGMIPDIPGFKLPKIPTLTVYGSITARRVR